MVANGLTGWPVALGRKPVVERPNSWLAARMATARKEPGRETVHRGSGGVRSPSRGVRRRPCAWFVDAVNGPVDCGGYVVSRSSLLGASQQFAGAMDLRVPVDFTYGGSRDTRNFAVEVSAGQLKDLGVEWLDHGWAAARRLYVTVSYGVDGSAHDPFLGVDFVHGEDYELTQVFDAFTRQMVSDPWLLGPGCVQGG